MRTDHWQARLIQLLSVAGIVTAFYLLLYHQGKVFSACKVNAVFVCGQVSGPGAPYSLIGLVGYAVIFLLIWLQDWLPVVEENLPELLIGTVGLAFLFTLYLTSLEFFAIGSFCQYCVWSAVIVLTMFILAISYLRTARSRA
ncbi:MAG: vitamin K epoxide reductase family protein [Anaerolineae bacterium]